MEGALSLAAEIRGLFDQLTPTRVPNATELRAYLTSRSQSVHVAGPNLVRPTWAAALNGAEDVLAELEAIGDVIGIRVWESRATGAYAELSVRRGTIKDVEAVTGPTREMPRRPFARAAVFADPTICGYRLPVYVEHEDQAVKLVTIHFDRPTTS